VVPADGGGGIRSSFTLLKPFFVCSLSSCADPWLVGIRAYYHAVLYPRVDALATKAAITSSNVVLLLGSTRPVRAITTVGPISTRGTTVGFVSARGTTIGRVPTQVTGKGPLGLAGEGKSIQLKGLTDNGAVCNGADGVNFIFGRLHGLKDNGESTTLIGCLQIMEDGMVDVVAAEDGHEALVQTVNQCVTYALGEPGFAHKWTHRVHHPLIISKHRDTDIVANCINVGLLDVLECCLRLVGVAKIQLVEN
jgi:hypothetical protein